MNYAVANILDLMSEMMYLSNTHLFKVWLIYALLRLLVRRRLPFFRFPRAGVPHVSNKSIVTAAFVALLIGMVFWMIKVQQAGGLMNLLLNLNDRSSLTADQVMYLLLRKFIGV